VNARTLATRAAVRVANPFAAIAASALTHPASAARNNPAAHAEALAQCFAVAHFGTDVYAAIRLQRRLGNLPNGDYLSGCHFDGWQITDSLCEDDTVEFRVLRDIAQDYLGMLATVEAGETASAEAAQ
jgi:hypothetical protein